MHLDSTILIEGLAEGLGLDSKDAKDPFVVKAALVYEPGMPLDDGFVYLAAADDLPPAPPPNRGFVMMVAGGRLPAAWRRAGCVTIAPAKQHSLSSLLWAVQQVFLAYDEWHAALQGCLDRDADIDSMLLHAAPVLGNPITVLDDRLEVVAATEADPTAPSGWSLGEFRAVPVDQIERLRSVADYTSIKVPYMHDDNGHERVYTVNFIVGADFRGSVSVSELNQPFRRSRLALFVDLASYVNRAMQARLSADHARFDPIKERMMALIEGEVVHDSDIERAAKGTGIMAAGPQSYTCMVLRPDDQTSLMVPEYLVTFVAKRAPGCLALPRQREIVLVSRLAGADGLRALIDVVTPVLGPAGYHLGVGDEFTHLREVRTAYTKARCAIETGLVERPEQLVYRFADFTFAYMLSQVTGDLDVADILPRGLKALLEHDARSDVSYVDTLRCYLDCQMNITRTAKALYLHRSSLAQRLERVFAMAGTTLEDDADRLHYGIALRLLRDRA